MDTLQHEVFSGSKVLGGKVIKSQKDVVLNGLNMILSKDRFEEIATVTCKKKSSLDLPDSEVNIRQLLMDYSQFFMETTEIGHYVLNGFVVALNRLINHVL